MPSPLEFLQQEYNGLNDDWRNSMAERKGNLAQMGELIQNSEAAKMTPDAAGMWGSLGNIFTQKGAINGMMEGRQNQALLRDKAALGAMPMMDQALADDSKQFSDLQRSVLGRLTSKESDMNNRYYMAGNTADGLILVDKGTGETTLTTIPSRFSAELPKIKDKWRDILIKGGQVNADEVDDMAHKYAMKEIGQMMGIHQFGGANKQGFQSPVRVPGSSPAMERPTTTNPPIDEELQSAMSSEKGAPIPSLAKESDMAKAMVGNVGETPVDGGPPGSGNVFGEPVHTMGGEANGMVWDKVNNKYVRKGKETQAQATSSSPMLKSAQQQETESVLGKNYGDQYVEDQKTMSDLKKMELSRQTMAQIIQSGKVNSGPMHEFLSKAGGYLAYIDPEGSLARNADNDALYFSQMMNLTRDKIKALGSGTAVSNLDLIVTQKSVGDLRNTREGNAKLLAIMELQNATMMSKLGNKMSFFETNNKSYDKYSGDPSPSHIVRASVVDGQRHYWVQSKKGWIDERVKNGDYKSIEQASKAFDNASVKATAALIKGTGLRMGGK